MDNLAVSEIFESVQGEGPNLGRPSTFLRLAHCNLHCIWCDTPYTWRYGSHLAHRSDKVYVETEETVWYTTEQLRAILYDYRPRHVVITGGEPMLQFGPVAPLINQLRAGSMRRWTFEFETAGTIAPDVSKLEVPINVSFTVSPKLANSGNSLKSRRREGVLSKFSLLGASFKFVVSSIEDFVEIDDIVTQFRIDRNRVYIMPEGIDAETISSRYQMLIPESIARGYNVTTRLQVLAFGNRRGV